MTSSVNVKTLLFVNSADKMYSHSFLFHCAKYWADKGQKVTYVAHHPIQDLPLSIGAPRASQNLENFHLIRFVYLQRWQDLLRHCYSVHLQPSPVSVIIVPELESYCTCEGSAEHDHVSLVCASLLQAASVCSSRTSRPSCLVAAYNSKNCVIPRVVTKNFFHSVWELKASDGDDATFLNLANLSRTTKGNDVKSFAFSVSRDGTFLNFESVFETVIETRG